MKHAIGQRNDKFDNRASIVNGRGTKQICGDGCVLLELAQTQDRRRGELTHKKDASEGAIRLSELGIRSVWWNMLA